MNPELDFNGYDRVGKYYISKLCMETYPCQHFVYNQHPEIDPNVYCCIDGVTICKMLKKNKLSHSHFNEYKYNIDCLNPFDDTNYDELFYRHLDPNQMIENEIQRAINNIRWSDPVETAEQRRINEYSASARLNKLKMQHNVKI